jgi:hypothetical protein
MRPTLRWLSFEPATQAPARAIARAFVVADDQARAAGNAERARARGRARGPGRARGAAGRRRDAAASLADESALGVGALRHQELDPQLLVKPLLLGHAGRKRSRGGRDGQIDPALDPAGELILVGDLERQLGISLDAERQRDVAAADALIQEVADSLRGT